MQPIELDGILKSKQLYKTPVGSAPFLMFKGEPDTHEDNKSKVFYASRLDDDESKIIEKMKSYYIEAGHDLETINWNPVQLKERKLNQ